jgi:quercetin dioxygenase-like cupin family protein
MTPGAIRAGDGPYVFDMSRANRVDANPGYTTAGESVIGGEGILVGLMHMPRGTGGAPHTHPNEQWIYCNRR